MPLQALAFPPSCTRCRRPGGGGDDGHCSCAVVGHDHDDCCSGHDDDDHCSAVVLMVEQKKGVLEMHGFRLMLSSGKPSVTITMECCHDNR